MTNTNPSPYELPREIAGLLAQTRKILVNYVGRLLGLRLVVAMLVAFLLGWGLDYLPVWFGGNEPGVAARVFFLAVASGLLGMIVLRGSRLLFWGKATNSQIALLLERKVPELKNGLLTLVSAAEHREPVSENGALMLRETEAQTMRLLNGFEPQGLLDQRRLNFWTWGALLIGMLTIGLASLFSVSFKTAGSRLLTLSSAEYLRQHVVELLGVRLRHDSIPESIPELSQAATFDAKGELYLARGMSLTVLAQVSLADWDRQRDAQPPGCELVYRSDSGLAGRVLMKRVGRFRDGVQTFELDSPPLDQLGHDLKFYLRSGDHSVGPFTIRTVEPPLVIATSLVCQFPEYMVDEESMRWTPRTIPWNLGTKLPQGTRIEIQGESSSPLSRALCIQEIGREKESEPMRRLVTEIPVEGREFRWPVEFLDDNLRGQIYLVDKNGVVAREPFLLGIDSIIDQPPRVLTRLEGIGLAITPQAQLPIRGRIEDDYGIAEAWVELTAPNQEELRIPLAIVPSGEVDGLVDLRKIKDTHEQISWEAGAERSLGLIVKARDHCDLRGSPNQGAGEAIRLELVTANELLRLLERRESSERRRLEQIYDELSRAREFLERMGNSQGTRSTQGTEPGDEPNDEVELLGADRQRLERETRAIYAGRLRLQIDKSANEIGGTAESFVDLRMQLINNRLNARERELRLAEQVIKPLEQISGELRGELRDNLRELQNQFQRLLKDTNQAEIEREISAGLKITKHGLDNSLAQLQEVIVILVKFDTQNELIDLVRGMLDRQTDILEKTREQRKKDAFKGLLD
ncbi:MAG: hypothetical protein KF851_12415 [Pirellulaceae bacterium]|nr:hypothetical protein [Pirellulaceae bacterium]